MEIVRKLPTDLAIRIYSFGCVEVREHHKKIKVELLDLRCLLRSCLNLRELATMPEENRAMIEKLCRLCRCCERHLQKNELKHKLPKNDCPCRCRQHVRFCVMLKE